MIEVEIEENCCPVGSLFGVNKNVVNVRTHIAGSKHIVTPRRSNPSG